MPASHGGITRKNVAGGGVEGGVLSHRGAVALGALGVLVVGLSYVVVGPVPLELGVVRGRLVQSQIDVSSVLLAVGWWLAAGAAFALSSGTRHRQRAADTAPTGRSVVVPRLVGTGFLLTGMGMLLEVLWQLPAASTVGALVAVAGGILAGGTLLVSGATGARGRLGLVLLALAIPVAVMALSFLDRLSTAPGQDWRITGVLVGPAALLLVAGSCLMVAIRRRVDSPSGAPDASVGISGMRRTTLLGVALLVVALPDAVLVPIDGVGGAVLLAAQALALVAAAVVVGSAAAHSHRARGRLRVATLGVTVATAGLAGTAVLQQLPGGLTIPPAVATLLTGIGLGVAAMAVGTPAVRRRPPPPQRTLEALWMAPDVATP